MGSLDSMVQAYNRKISLYVNEEYNIEGLNGGDITGGFIPMPFAKVILSKVYNSIRPFVEGGPRTVALAPLIQKTLENTVTYGNSTIIVNSDGEWRISNPLNSYALKTGFGMTQYFEAREQDKFWYGVNQSNLWLIDEYKRQEESSDVFFSTFYQESDTSPNGRSRLTPSMIKLIRNLSVISYYIGRTAHLRGAPLLVINGYLQEMLDIIDNNDLESIERKAELQTGIDKIIAIPAGSSGEKAEITQIEVADNNPLINTFNLYLGILAAAGNVDGRDTGVKSVQPSSAEAIYASKEDISLEIQNIELSCQGTILEALEYSAELFGEEKPKLSWGSPHTASMATMADFFSKMTVNNNDVVFHKSMLRLAGFAPNEVSNYRIDGGTDV